MAFKDDPVAQAAAIRSNLAECTLTLASERVALSEVVEAALGATEATSAHVGRAGRAVRALVEAQSWYFQGTAVSTDVVYSAKREDRLRIWLSKAILETDPALTLPDADDIAVGLIGRITSAATFGLAKIEHGSLPLHADGSPFWMAIEDGAEPPLAQDIAYLPERLGLWPDEVRGQRYLLLRLHRAGMRCMKPRFADSQGNPYWRPKGRTHPTEECLAHLPGVKEVVGNGLSVSDLHAEGIVFNRA